MSCLEARLAKAKLAEDVAFSRRYRSAIAFDQWLASCREWICALKLYTAELAQENDALDDGDTKCE